MSRVLGQRPIVFTLSTLSAEILIFRDPNCFSTIDVFEKSTDWIKCREFSASDVDEAKLSVFSQVHVVSESIYSFLKKCSLHLSFLAPIGFVNYCTDLLTRKRNYESILKLATRISYFIRLTTTQ